jgi:thiol-disulfide isomerase/thioredoxin
VANAPYPTLSSNRVRPATSKKLFRITLLSLLGISLIGCNNSGNDEEIKAENSGYAVADDKGTTAATEKDSTSNNAASPATDNTPKTDQDLANKAAAPPAAGGSTPAATPAPNTPAATPAPSNSAGAMPAAAGATPGKTGGVVNEAPSFATLTYPTTEESADMVAFLGKADQAVRDLAVWGSQGMVPEAQFRAQGARILEMKLTAATKLLEKKDLTESDMRVARKAKLQALSQLSGLGDVKANDALRTYVDEVIQSGDPELVHNARLMQLGYAAEALMGGKSKDPNELLSRIDEVLSDENYRGAVELMQVRQATGLLEQMGYTEQATAVRQKVGKLFEKNKDPNLANAAWQILAEQHPATNGMRDAMQAIMKGEASAKEQLKAAAERMIVELPPERTVMFLVSQIVNVEFSGQPEAASILVEVANANLDKITDEKAKAEVATLFEGFKTRQAIIGKELSFAGIVDTTGKPLDWSAYSGKVVLVDFWATWCQPCLIELPNVEKAYAAFKDKGFEVIGVNLDDNVADLQGFFQQKTLPWMTYRNADPNQIGFEMPLAKELGVQAIPFVLLIGKDGKVAKLHVRGEGLIPAIEELLK